MFKNIIVGLDGSDKSTAAARIACDLALHGSGKITLVHVPHAEAAAFVVGAVAGYHAATTAPTLEEIDEAGKKILDEGLKIAAEAGCKDVATHMPHGDAATEMLAYADEIGADLIVTGRRGLSGLASFVLGSTTQRVNHLAKCACLSIV